jgi:glycosyltransferase involved in cell wall biosynthesis
VSFLYLATPYSRYVAGIEAAYVMACEQQALLVRAGVPVFCPISHTHGAAIHGGIDPLDHTVWMPADEPFMAAASGLIMVMADGWEESYGMKIELETFRAAGKPVVWMTVGVVPEELSLA